MTTILVTVLELPCTVDWQVAFWDEILSVDSILLVYAYLASTLSVIATSSKKAETDTVIQHVRITVRTKHINFFIIFTVFQLYKLKKQWKWLVEIHKFVWFHNNVHYDLSLLHKNSAQYHTMHYWFLFYRIVDIHYFWFRYVTT